MKQMRTRAGACLLLPALFYACEPVQDRTNRAEVLAVVSTGVIAIEPGATAELAVQAQNDDGKGIDDVRLFFLISDTSVLTFADRSDTDFLQVKTTEQEAAGLRAAGVAKVSVMAGADSGGKHAKVLAGLVSPSDTTPESGVVSIDVSVNAPQNAAGAGGTQ
jgi:hypothetical protein